MNDAQKKTLELLLPYAVTESQLVVPRGKLPDQLCAEIAPSDTTKLLVAGQRGMGKTTELKRFIDQLGVSEFVPVFLQFGAQPTISHAGLIYAMGQALFLHAQSKLDEKSFRHFQEWFSQEEFSSTIEEGSEGEAGLGGEYIVLQAKKKITRKSATKKQKSHKVVKDTRELMNSFNNLIQKARKNSGKRVVFVVDDIDKIQDASSIENTFIHSAHFIGQIDCPCIFTVPITYATSSYLRIATLPYTSIYRVPAVELMDSKGTRNEAAFDFMRKVFRLRMPFNPIPPVLLDRVLEYSGGALIDAMRMMRGLCKRAILEQITVIDEAAVEEEFQRLVDDYKFVFDTPVLWQKLSKICKAPDKQAIMIDDILTEMLYKMIVIEYWEKKLWFDLHPAARKLYEQNASIIDGVVRGQ
jgi:KAP family P-loop domain